MGFFDVTDSLAFKFDRPGAGVSGVITGEPRMEQQTDIKTSAPMIDKNGRPEMMMIVNLATADRDPSNPEDKGERAVYINKFAMRKAIGEALRMAGVTDIAEGGHLSVKYTHDQPSQTPGMNAQKIFAASYAPPTSAAGQFITGATTPAAPAPAAPSQPAPAYVPPTAANVGQAPAAAPAPAPEPGNIVATVKNLAAQGLDASTISTITSIGLPAVTAILAL